MHLRFSQPLALAILVLLAGPVPAAAQDRLCDPGNEDCRAILLNYIRNETVGIDVGFWFMEDARYTNELIQKFRDGVPVRVLIDTRANTDYPLNAERLAELRAAGIPMRRRLTSYILHWKTMLFHGQNVVEFSGANYSANAWLPLGAGPYENYIDEAIYFTSDTAIVDSFRTRFDDQWINTTEWADYANIAGPLSRRYEIFPQDPSLNFVPWQNFRSRSVNAYRAESRHIDAIMYRITDRAHSDQMLAAVARGVPVRLITEPAQYRLQSRMWHAWNVDRMYMGGVQIKHRAHAGLNHQKSVILYDQNAAVPGDQPLVIFGSSNWTSPSADGQVEHNMFTSRPYVISWFVSQFQRKWNNSEGVIENTAFVPLPPDPPRNPVPAVSTTNLGTTVTLTWYGGPWAHLYDLYLDTNPDPVTPIASNLAETPSKTATSTFSYRLPFTLRQGTTYYWKVVGKTMALQTRSSAVWSFKTGGLAPCAGESGDYDADCRSDITVFRPSDGTWYHRMSADGSTAAIRWGQAGDVPVAGDYDGDGKADPAVYRPSIGTWFLRYSRTGATAAINWGVSTDLTVPGDYDGDGWTDIAVFRPANATWYLRYSRTGVTGALPLGLPGDVPVPGDYDGDLLTDFAVYRPDTGMWYVRYSTTQTGGAIRWGTRGDITVPGDYDGDGLTDIALYRPSEGVWYLRYSRTGTTAAYRWGEGADRPVPGDYDGDLKTDLAIFRPSTGVWWVWTSSNSATAAVAWGYGTDIPVLERR